MVLYGKYSTAFAFDPPMQNSLYIYIYSYIHIKTSGIESRPSKVELVSAHKNTTTTMSVLHITTKLVNTPTKQPYCIDISIS